MSPILKGLLTYGGTIALIGVTWGLTTQTVKQNSDAISELKKIDKDILEEVDDSTEKLAKEIKESNKMVTDGLMEVQKTISTVEKDVAVMVERTKHLKK